MPEKPIEVGFDDEFAAVAVPAEAAPEATPADEGEPTQPHRVEIDLEDGSGKQVFEAPTPEELISKLTEAQTNATKKIREQERRLKAQRALRRGRASERVVEAPAPPKAITVEELAALSSQLYTDPLAALPRLLEGSIGLTAQELREAVVTTRQTKKLIEEQQAAEEFVRANPEYYSSNKNYKLMKDYLDDNDLDFTAENLQIAYEELQESGLLDVVPQQVATAADAAPQKPQAKPANALPGRTATPAAAPSGVPSVEEFTKLTPQQQRERILQLQHGQRK